MTRLLCDIYPSLMAAHLGADGWDDKPFASLISISSHPSRHLRLFTVFQTILCPIDLWKNLYHYILGARACCPTTVFWIPPANCW